MLSHPNWMKLYSACGGAPEIPFFSYIEETKVEREGGEIVVEKKTVHDWEPVKVRVHQANSQGELTGESFMLLVSLHITA